MDDNDTVLDRMSPSTKQLKEGNGDWDANRKLIGYLIEEHSKDIDVLYSRIRANGKHLHRLEIRIASYIGSVGTLLYFVEKGFIG